ncbi:MAG: hypothetical protein HUU22_02540 [Phycisphaerae bacterium]|nr:DUF5658 family protein [Phycisphaerae bacterium]NUQ44892.1 hypothetical protein [Phycisphaerae bacterium]
MTTLPGNPYAWSARDSSASPQTPPALEGRVSLGDWLARRPVRVGLLLMAVALLNGFDLTFTIMACRLGPFIELNPLAASVIDTGNYTALTFYKIGLVAAGSFILWQFRAYRISEVGCWMLALLYTGVSLRWFRYYETWHQAFHES